MSKDIETVPSSRPKISKEKLSTLMVVAQSRNRTMEDGTLGFQDFATIRTYEDWEYACLMVEGRHTQFDMDTRIEYCGEILYARKENKTPEQINCEKIVEALEDEIEALESLVKYVNKNLSGERIYVNDILLKKDIKTRDEALDRIDDIKYEIYCRKNNL